MSIDEEYLRLLQKHIEDEKLIANLSVFNRRMYFSKILGHYEIYKKVAFLPGDVIELGVYRGESLLNFARFMEILNPGDRVKRVIGFDHWKGLSGFTSIDGKNERVGNVEGGWNPENFYETLLQLVDLFHKDSFVPHKARIKLVSGDIKETAARFAEEEPGLRISLLHLDCDLYEPTLAGLQAFYPKVVPGGIVLFDEYGISEWPGETRAVEDYFKDKLPKMEKFGWLSAPGAWFVKGEAP